MTPTCVVSCRNQLRFCGTGEAEDEAETWGMAGRYSSPNSTTTVQPLQLAAVSSASSASCDSNMCRSSPAQCGKHAKRFFFC